MGSNDFDEHIIRLYARGMTVREIQGFMAEQYNTQVCHDFISTPLMARVRVCWLVD